MIATERLNNNRWGQRGEDEEESDRAEARGEDSEESQRERESLPRGRGEGVEMIEGRGGGLSGVSFYRRNAHYVELAGA